MKKTEPRIVALVDSESERRNFLRHQLDALGHASSIFDSLNDLMSLRGDARKFGCVIVAPRNEEALSQIPQMLKEFSFPFLLIADEDDFFELSLIDEPALWPKRIDVISSQCSINELQWRLISLIQQSKSLSAGEQGLSWGAYRFDVKRRQAWIGERKIPLKPMEFALALSIFRNINTLVARKDLYSLLWGEQPVSLTSRKLDICVSNVRTKMELNSQNGFLLISIYGRGYRLNSVGTALDN